MTSRLVIDCDRLRQTKRMPAYSCSARPATAEPSTWSCGSQSSLRAEGRKQSARTRSLVPTTGQVSRSTPSAKRRATQETSSANLTAAALSRLMALGPSSRAPCLREREREKKEREREGGRERERERERERDLQGVVEGVEAGADLQHVHGEEGQEVVAVQQVAQRHQRLDV